jgi:hypothetical protein
MSTTLFFAFDPILIFPVVNRRQFRLVSLEEYISAMPFVGQRTVKGGEH